MRSFRRESLAVLAILFALPFLAVFRLGQFACKTLADAISSALDRTFS